MSNLGISEIFTSIQGEGILSGRPSIFIRFSGCNQKCNWCDTPVMPSNSNITMESIKNMIDGFPGYDVVITGGEPLLHSSQIKDIVEMIREMDCRAITIETNGTIMPPSDFGVDLFSVSPKLSSSGENYSLPVIEAFAEKSNVQFKFVVDGDNQIDIIDLKHICESIFDYTNIIVQPVAYPNDTKTVYMPRYTDLIKTILDLKLDNNIRITPQLHKLAWGFDTNL